MGSTAKNDPPAVSCPICGAQSAVRQLDGRLEMSEAYPFCSERCRLVDLSRWLDRLLSDRPQPPVVWRKAVLGAGFLARDAGALDAARAHAETGLALARAADDGWGVGMALLNLGIIASYEGDLSGAKSLLEQSLARAQVSESAWMAGMALLNLGYLDEHGDDPDGARRLFERALAAHRAIGAAPSSPGRGPRRPPRRTERRSFRPLRRGHAPASTRKPHAPLCAPFGQAVWLGRRVAPNPEWRFGGRTTVALRFIRRLQGLAGGCARQYSGR